ncbi:MAG: TetR/AcrR family transcriptional regulator [Clostridium sp.]|nr:TetR/AcrR family transcriptional regulator [Clostridium sp.]
MEDILQAARCSKGRFYYYFHAKAELLDSLYEIFDQKYIERSTGRPTPGSAFWRSTATCSGSFRMRSAPSF